MTTPFKRQTPVRADQETLAAQARDVLGEMFGYFDQMPSEPRTGDDAAEYQLVA